MTRELIGIAYSPWTEKARWALDHHRLPYQYSEHHVLFGEPSLRFKLRRLLKGDVTVPALIDGNTRIMESFRIAIHADHQGTGQKLFPEMRLGEIRAFDDLSERALAAGRAMVMARIRLDREAQMESLPPFIPPRAHALMRPLVAVGLAYLDMGFGVSRHDPGYYEAELREVMSTLDQALRKCGGDYLLGDYSYADITMAVALQPVLPVSDNYIKIKPAVRRAWIHEKLGKEFPGLLEWRDRIYRKHRQAT